MRRAVLTLLVVTAATTTRGARADVVELPSGRDPVPLVVVLHGDREHAPAAAARWRAATHRRGWALLALECPHDLGCTDSFWKWDGEPSWVFERVAALAKRRAIDLARVYLVGWSGGASYIGWRAPAWSAHFAAVVLHGGGIPPDRPDVADCPNPGLPAYFLVGNKNPLHDLARELRAYFERCRQDVTWDLIEGADHAREETALTATKANAILDWLAERHR
ncbi:MAG TPA: PHB depolymerase family esterase [Kofleriaceae bacterium]|jgi:poly(3-hydroxybutyrate) depolymerase